MNLIKQAVEYTKEAWNKLNLSTKVNNFYIKRNIEYDSELLEYKENILKYLNENNIDAAYRYFKLVKDMESCKKELEQFKKYLEEEHDN